MFKPYSVFRYLIVLFAITYQSQAFCIETDSKSNPQAMSNLKEYGLDKRVKIMGAILLIFAPLGLMAYNKNKQGTLGKESQINILERKSLDQTSSIFLVEIQGTTLLLSKTTAGISLIKEIYTSSPNLTWNENPTPAVKNVSLVSNNS